MKKLLYLISVPILAVSFGFKSPEIDLNHNIRKPQHKVGTDKKRSNEHWRKLKSRLTNKEFLHKVNQRLTAEFYVRSWFVASFLLDLDENPLLRVRDIYAKAISSIGNITKGEFNKGNREKLNRIHSTFNRELRGTLNSQQYRNLYRFTRNRYRKTHKKVDQGEI